MATNSTSTTTTQQVVNSSTWNLPESTNKTININKTESGSYSGGNDRKTTKGTQTTTVSTSTSESKVSSAYSYKTTGSSYTSSISGEEIVNTTTSAMQLIAQPYMKAGEEVLITGKDFSPNCEIRLYFDDTIVSPVLSNKSFETSDDRPWVWAWCYTDTNTCKFYAPDTSLIYYYDDSTSSWSDTTKDMTWTKYITRTPWIRTYIDSLTDGAEKTAYQEANDTDIATSKSYINDFSKSKITIITDTNGSFEAYIAVPENTPTGSHTITAEVILYPDENSDYYNKAITSITGTSYLRHWDTVVYKRQVEVVKETVYRDVTRTDTYQKYATVNTTTTTDTYSYTWNSDPVAQTFKVDTDQFLVALDLYFAELPETYLTDSSQPWIALREVNDGVPSEELIYLREINKDELKDADSTGTVASTPTHIIFDYPIYVSSDKTYAFTVGCNTNGYKIYYSQLGMKDLTDGTSVLYQNQQVEDGVMMTSSNNSVWSPMQEADVKFVLYKAMFVTRTLANTLSSTDSSSATYKDRVIYVTNIDTGMSYFSSLNVSLSTNTFENTGVDVYYAITVGENNKSETVEVLEGYEWHPLVLENLVTFVKSDDYLKGMNLKLKICLWTENSDVTPSVNLDSLEIFVSNFEDSGSYVQNIINLKEE